MSTDLPADQRTPDVHDWILAEAQRQHTAVVERREAEAREWLSGHLYAALVDGMRQQARQYPGFSAYTTNDAKLYAVNGVMDVDDLAAKALEVFVDFLRNPPVREQHSDGTETVRTPA